MKVRLTPRAARDLADIADYIRERNPAAAQRVRVAIMKSLTTLASFPHIGRRQDVEHVRKLVVGRYGYLIYYRANVTSRRREYTDG